MHRARSLVSPAEVRSLAQGALGPTPAGALETIGSTLYRLCGGWQPLVEQALRCGTDPWEADEDPLARLSRIDSPLTRWVEQHLLPALPAEGARMLGLARDLEPFPRELVADLCPVAVPAYDDLCERALVGPNARGDPRVVPLIAAVVSRRHVAEGGADWYARAASWYLTADLPGSALRAARYSGDPGRYGSIIERFGDVLIGSGWSREILECMAALSRTALSVRSRMIWGHAARVAGCPQKAVQILEDVLDDLNEVGEAPPSDLAWRLAQCYYGQGDHVRAAACGRGALVALADPEPASDRARRLACLSSTLRASGDIPAAVQAADDAVASVDECSLAEEASARTTARLARAVLMYGARRLNLLATALTEAEAAGDLFLVQRTLVNLSDAHLVAGDYPAARDLARRAVDLVEWTGPVGCFGVALHNEGEALVALGDLDTARHRFLECLNLARRNGQGRTPAPLLGLAEIEYQRGRLGDARAAFQEAVDVARECGDTEILVPALARLATVLATEGRDGSEARMLAEAVVFADEAVRRASPEQEPAALVGRGWVALALDEADVLARADRAVDTARNRQVRRALGEALELQAATAEPGRCASTVLRSAVEVHDSTSSQCYGDRLRVILAELPDGTREQQTSGRAAARRLRERGYSTLPLHPGRGLPTTRISIRVLGPLQVLTDGVSVPTSAWRSRQARTLLKLLVAGQGRSICREELCETLWPGDELQSCGHRLSVVLSTLRSALDPGRREPAEHFITAGENGLRLAENHVQVDLSEFLADAQEGARLAERLDETGARHLLARTLNEHRGDPFEDDPYEPWALQVRDYVRAVRAQSLRLLARLAGRAGNIDEAVTWLEQLLGLDPFDEPAHRLLVGVLVRSGRHGAARHAFERWTRANREIGVPVPDPRALHVEDRREAMRTREQMPPADGWPHADAVVIAH